MKTDNKAVTDSRTAASVTTAVNDFQQFKNSKEYPDIAAYRKARDKHDSRTVASKCQYVGCPNTARHKLTQTVGKLQTLLVCNAHLPVWAAENGKGSPFYKVSSKI
jgi:hypothetical protein